MLLKTSHADPIPRRIPIQLVTYIGSSNFLIAGSDPSSTAKWELERRMTEQEKRLFGGVVLQGRSR